MAKVKDTDYVFLSAYLRAKEAKMLSSEMLDNLLTAGSFADAARTLTECGYTDMSEMNSQQVEQELTRYRNAEMQDVAEAAAQKELVDLFRLPYDYHNAKVLVKTAGKPGSADKLLSSAGRIPPAEMTEAFLEEDYSVLPEIMARAVTEASHALATTQNPQLSDMILDRAYYSELLALAKDIGDEFALGYVHLMIDAANLRCMVRSLRMNRDLDFIREALYSGGEITEKAITDCLADGHDFAALYESSPLRKAAEIGKKTVKGGHLTEFELESDNALIAYLAGSGSITFGVGPVLSYLSSLENQTTALRMILTGWLNNIPAQKIRERLRDSNA